MSDAGPSHPLAETPLDARREAELKARLAAIRRQTESSWRDASFWVWLLERLKWTSRRQKK